MKLLVLILLLAGTLPTAPVLAEPVSPLLGTWAVDIDALPIPPQARPKSVTMTYSDAGSGKWRTHVEVVLPDGKTVQATSTYVPDGTPVRVEGNLEADVAAAKVTAPNVMVTALALGGQLGHIAINCGIAARACQLWLGLRQCLNSIKTGLRCMKARAQHLYIGRPMLHLLRMGRKAGCICNLLGLSLAIDWRQ